MGITSSTSHEDSIDLDKSDDISHRISGSSSPSSFCSPDPIRIPNTMEQHMLLPTMLDNSNYPSMEAKKRVEVALRNICFDKRIRYGRFLNSFCAFYACQGTSHSLDGDLKFNIVTDGLQRNFYHRHFETLFKEICPTLSFRQVMRMFADKTRMVLVVNLDLSPIYFRKFGMQPREIAFDYSDGCVAPPLSVRSFTKLAMWHIYAMAEEDED